MNFRKILVTTDFSEEARRAFPVAEKLAKKHQARICLLTVVQNLPVLPRGAPLAPRLPDPEIEQDVKEAKEKIEAVRQKWNPGVDVEVAVEVGDVPADTIVKFADNNNVDLILMSTHGRSGLRRFVLGSVTEEVLRRSHIPVLCLPHPADDEN